VDTAVRAALAFVVALAVAVAGLGYVHATMPSWYARFWYPLRYEAIISGHARNYDLEPALLAAVVYEESHFNAAAVSDAGAIGLMQLHPQTAEGIALRTGGNRFELSDLYDPEINVRYGAWYLRHLIDKYGDVETALAAYNGGQGNVNRGVVYDETKEYVADVLRTREIYDRAYADELEALR
jgi:soluble lytic murein transglycosylase